MILYVNGDSHTAGAEAVNPHAFAEDDPNLIHLGRLPHPDNLAVSWGKKLSTLLKMAFYCDAESAASNDRIIRTTKEYINNHPQDVTDLFVISYFSISVLSNTETFCVATSKYLLYPSAAIG